MPLSRSATRTLLGLLYVTGAVLIVDQLLILFTSISPLSPTSAGWRFGAMGLGIGRATPLLLADTLIILAALWLGHGLMMRIWGGVHFVLAVGLLVLLGLFALDAIQVRQQLVPEAQSAMLLGAARAAVMALVLSIWSAWLAIHLLRISKQFQAPRSERGSALIVGQDPGEEAAS